MKDLNKVSLLASYLQLLLYAKQIGISKKSRMLTSTMLNQKKGAKNVKRLLELIIEQKYGVETSLNNPQRYNNNEFYLYPMRLSGKETKFIRSALDSSHAWMVNKLPPLSKETVALRLVQRKLLSKLEEILSAEATKTVYFRWWPGEHMYKVFDQIDEKLSLLVELGKIYKEATAIKMITSQLLRRRNDT